MKKIFFGLSIFIIVAFSLHAFHLSNTTIVYEKSSKTIKITIRCFIDDIEKTINELDNITLELGNERELKDADKHLEKYILKNFKIAINKNQVALNFLGKEVDKDIIYFYLKVKNISKISRVKVENKILLETFDDQQNVVRLEINGKKKSLIFKNDDFNKEYRF